MEIRLHPKKVTRLLSSIGGVLLVFHLMGFLPFLSGDSIYPASYFNFDAEGNIPTLFSVFLLVFCAMLTGAIGVAVKRSGGKFMLWLFLGVVFLFISIDESVMIHERIGDRVQLMFNTGGYLFYAWVIPYSVMLFAFCVLYLPFFFRLPTETRKGCVIAAVLYVGGGLGMELPESAWFVSHGHDGAFMVMATVEEILEMSGCIVFIHTFCSYIDRHHPNLSLRITTQES